ncbi:Ig family protein [Niastella koreensis GR20-10]|uniref:Ig family protein n=2 Tax=Niastella koreensis TaxID=354356 RepID=G8TRA6_NIAKG|nr:Ig family protein [Niastella koreensis GR20-10]
MRMPHYRFSMKLLISTLFALLIAQLFFSCKKSDKVTTPLPVIAYKQKVISIAEDVSMTPVKPDSTGGAITEYNINPLLPKGLLINKTNGEISGTPSDTLNPTRFIVTAKGPGGMATDTITMLIGTVGFNYGNLGTFTFEKGSTDLSVTALSPQILAGTFVQFFCAPSPDSLTIKTRLKFNSKNGQINGIPDSVTSTDEVPKPATFIITGITTTNKAASATINIYVNDKKPNFAYTYPGSFSVNTSVGTSASSLLTPTVLTNSGVIKKFRMAPQSPALPAGLALDSMTGKITGTPTASFNSNIIIRGLNTGGYQDVSYPLLISTNAVPPQVYYLMSVYSGNTIDTICTRMYSGDPIYLTKSDSIGQANIYITPVVCAGQLASPITYTVTAPFTSGASNENLVLTPSTGMISGSPAGLFTSGTPAHTINIPNAQTSGAAGTFTTNIISNTNFFKYNADGGKAKFVQNGYGFVVNQKIDVANGIYPGYASNWLAPQGGAGVVSYAIYPLTTIGNVLQPLSNFGLTFNTTTGAISGTPTAPTQNLSNLVFCDYVIVGKKSDGSFTYYKIKVKVYSAISDWGS